MDIVTRSATWADLPAAATVLAAAFDTSPWTRWTVDARDHAARLTQLQLLALEQFAMPFGAASLTTVDGEIVCVAAWTDSESSNGVDAERRLDPTVASRVADLEGDRHAASAVAELQLAAVRPTEAHLALGVIGTRPSAQRRGHGMRTLRPLLDLADERALPIWLETSEQANVAFYERLGFAVEQHVEIEDGGPDVWLMRRDAHV